MVRFLQGANFLFYHCACHVDRNCLIHGQFELINNPSLRGPPGLIVQFCRVFKTIQKDMLSFVLAYQNDPGLDV